MTKYFIIVSVLLSFFSTTAMGYQFQNIKKVHNSVGSDLNFNKMVTYDFNKDGTNDIVSCSRNQFLRIRDGKNKKELFSWKGPDIERTLPNGDKWYKSMPGCEVTQIPGQRPMVIMANFWNTTVWRSNAWQWVAYHNGSKYVVKALEIEGFGKYNGVSRSVECGKYPQKLVDKGYKKGVLCFFSDYASDHSNRSVLLKLEQSSDKKKIIAKDLTPTSGLMWKGGARGTSIWTMPVGSGWAHNQRDGAFMMDSDFLDFNKDGLTDFVTVGQHARVRAHKMILDITKPEGVRYTTEALTTANRHNDMTEFLKVKAFNKVQRNKKNSCLYFSSEIEGGKDRDHIRCFHLGRWQLYHLPINFDSEYFNARINMDKSLGVIIKTKRKAGNVWEDITFRIPKGENTAAVKSEPTPTVPVTPVIPTCYGNSYWNGSWCEYLGP